MISVIIPVYNTAKFLSTCIKSVINQTFEDIEIILVNDASTDNSIHICNTFREKDVLKRMYDKAIETDVDYVEVGMQRVLDRHKIIKKKAYSIIKGLITQPQLFDSYYISFFGVNILSVNIWGKLYKSRILQNPTQPIGLAMGEDLYFNLELFPHLQKNYIDDY